MNDPLPECIWFYTGADYLIINAFLWKNKEALGPCLDVVWQNNRCVIREAEAEGPEKRFAEAPLDGVSLYRAYIKRTPEALDFDSKRAMLMQAIADIRLLCGSMKPLEDPILLYRNLGKGACLRNVGEGDPVDLPGITSTSTTGQQIDYGNNDMRKPAQILKLEIPAGMPALFIEGAEHEVLLPPMRYTAAGVGVENDVPTVALRALSPLDLEEVIRSASEAFSEYFDRQK